MKCNFQVSFLTHTFNLHKPKFEVATQKNLLQAMHQTTTNKMGKTKPIINKNQDHPLLNYLLKNTPSKLKNNFTLLEKKLEQEI
jgi:hypothetical protein